MTLFRPCIDIHNGKVKQIVGSSLSDSGQNLKTNFESEQSPAYFAKLYKADDLKGGHVIMLGRGNETVAKEALNVYKKGLQIGGGITPTNALDFLEAGASHVIVTSFLFENNDFSFEKLKEISSTVGKERLVLDLSCKKTKTSWNVATNRWQTLTTTEITPSFLEKVSDFCDEFLVHAADVEGKQAGMDVSLIKMLAEYSPLKVTYAGGARNLDDLKLCKKISEGKVDLTIGSALDIFGGTGVKYKDLVAFNWSENE